MNGSAIEARTGGDNPVVGSRQVCRRFLAAVVRLRGAWRLKVAEQIAERIGTTPRTVQRWMAGENTPDADVGYELIRTDHGPAIVESIVADMSPVERAKFWNEMGRRAKRQRLLAERDRISAEIEAGE